MITKMNVKTFGLLILYTLLWVALREPFGKFRLYNNLKQLK